MLEREKDRSTERTAHVGAGEAGARPPLTPWVRLDEDRAASHDAECSEGAQMAEGLLAGGEGEARGDVESSDPDVDGAPRRSRRPARRRGQRTVPADAASTRAQFTAEQRLLALDTWQLSGLDATEFAPLIGASPSTLYDWKRKFADEGPAGLEDRPRGGRSGSR